MFGRVPRRKQRKSNFPFYNLKKINLYNIFVLCVMSLAGKPEKYLCSRKIFMFRNSVSLLLLFYVL